VKGTLHENLEENNRHYQEVRIQLDKWADDRELAAEQELDQVKKKIKEQRRALDKVKTMYEQHLLQKDIEKLEKEKNSLRRNIFKVEDEIAEKRRNLLEGLETRMKQRSELATVFEIKWTVI
jgi:predicted  nucleic acid-binding Zn-ribbon protein